MMAADAPVSRTQQPFKIQRSIPMPKSSFVDFKAVKAAVTMEQVLERYGLLGQFKRQGESLSGPCPIHQGTNPTQFRVSTSKNLWNCFSECKNGGNVLDFIAQMEDVSIHAAALKAIAWFGLKLEAQPRDPESPERDGGAPPAKGAARGKPKEGAPEQEKAGPNVPLKFRLDKLQPDHPFLAERGLAPETVAAFGAGFCAKGMMAGRIAIPIHNAEGAVVAYAGRWPGEATPETPKYKLPPGFRKSLELFNLDRAAKAPADQPLVIVEGFFDCMALHQRGCQRVVALMGTSLSTAQEDLILQRTEPNAHLVIMLDEDDAGRGVRAEMAGRLAFHRFVRVHRFEKEGQQPCDLTAEELQKLLGQGNKP
jgi:DNA primase